MFPQVETRTSCASLANFSMYNSGLGEKTQKDEPMAEDRIKVWRSAREYI
ncbi:MAG: hypothetical protein J0G99_11285 [Alphaproteobacteria bacterium]|nr:hypothetical protein [Alphaproteobacteria bacterium]